jgi:putative phosphoribosyl transferase
MRGNPRLLNRDHAGAILARKLRRYRGAPDTVVLGLPHGGVIVAAALAERLRLPFDVFVTRKLSPPEEPWKAIGAVSETGLVYLDESVLAKEPWVQRYLREYLEEEIEKGEEEVARRIRTYRGSRRLPPLRGRTVILVDEAAFSGASFVAAVRSLKRIGVSKIVAALPAGMTEALINIGHEVNEMTVLVIEAQIDSLEDCYCDCSDISEQAIAYTTQRREALVKSSARRAG